MKANPALSILKLAGAENLGFDVVSEGEMRRVLASSPDQKKLSSQELAKLTKK